MKNKGKKFIYKVALSCSLALGMFGANTSYDVRATEISDVTTTSETSVEKPQYNAAVSTVQVVLVYQDESQVYHILQSGSGVVLDSSSVVTNKQLLVMSEEKKIAAGEYLSAQLGKTISFVQTEGGGEVSSYQIAIIEQADIYIFATEAFSSSDWDVAILSLSQPIAKEPAVIGTNEFVEPGSQVSVVGFPTCNYDSAVSYQIGDVMVTTGACSTSDASSITYDARLEAGNSGGALVDEYGRVVGITSYTGDDTGLYQAMPIDSIKPYFAKNNVAYKEDVTDYREVDVVEPENTAAPTTDKRELERTIKEADLIYQDGNDDVYTSDSFRELQLNLEYAKLTFEDEYADQRQIDTDCENLRNAIDDLEKIKKDKTVLIVVISVGSVLLLGGIIVLIVFLVKRSKKKKMDRIENQRLKTYSSLDSFQSINATSSSTPTYQNNVSVMNNTPQGNAGSQAYAQFDAKMGSTVAGDTNFGTTILRANEGTTILNAEPVMQQVVNAYLYHMADGTSIAIDAYEYVLGKDYQGVNYRIDNNAAVSRRHAMITRKYDDYFIEDLNSTNGVCVNGAKLAPGYKQVLSNNDEITLADEKFIFMMN